jgi:hypothetical protein
VADDFELDVGDASAALAVAPLSIDSVCCAAENAALPKIQHKRIKTTFLIFIVPFRIGVDMFLLHT